MNVDWDRAVAHALTLPGTAVEPHYGQPAVKINGRAFLFSSREEGSFGLGLDLDIVEMLMETDPDTFWQSPHYKGWPSVLVRHDSDDPERVLATIERAYAYAASRKPPRKR